MKTSVMVSTLPLITDAETFFNTDKVLYLDVLSVDSMPNLTRLKLEIKKQVLKLNDKFYMPILSKGSPGEFIFEWGKRIAIALRIAWGSSLGL